jgi:DNA-binding CsgD family transcriptional regulator
MSDNSQFSEREKEVTELLLQGKSNKLIAASLGISSRTVEFHLKNIYAKFQVSSRIELILKLGNTTGRLEFEKLGYSTVDNMRKTAENRVRFNSRMNWTASLKDVASIIGKELEMKNLLSSKHLLVGMTSSFVIGLLWLFVLSSKLSPNQIAIFVAPLIIIWLIIGFLVGLIGKRRGATLIKVAFSALLGTGLSPLMIIPFMVSVALPIGILAERLGLIDPATMSNDFALTLSASIMITVWFVTGAIIGIIAVGDIKKPESPIVLPLHTN